MKRKYYDLKGSRVFNKISLSPDQKNNSNKIKVNSDQTKIRGNSANPTDVVKLQSFQIKPKADLYSQNKTVLDKISKLSNVNVTSKNTLTYFNKVNKPQNLQNITNSFKQKEEQEKSKDDVSSLDKGIINKVLSYFSSDKLNCTINNKIVTREEHYSFNNTNLIQSNTENLIITDIIHPYNYENKNILIVSKEKGKLQIYNMYRPIFDYDVEHDISKKEIQSLHYLESLKDLFLSLSTTNQIKLWGIFKEQCIKTIWFHDKIMTCCCFNKSNMAFGLQNNGEIFFLDILKNASNKSSGIYHSDWVIVLMSLPMSKISNLIMSISYDKTIQIIDTNQRKALRRLNLESISRKAIELNNEMIATSHDDGKTILWTYMQSDSVYKVIENTHNSIMYSISIDFNKDDKPSLFVSSFNSQSIAIIKDEKIKNTIKTNSKIKKFNIINGTNHFTGVSIGFMEKGFVLYGKPGT